MIATDPPSSTTLAPPPGPADPPPVGELSDATAGLGNLGRGAALVRDVILGGQDGLVNVLGLVLGMAVATGDSRVVITAGLAAMLAESIAMAGVAYTASGAERALAIRAGSTIETGAAERQEERRRTFLEALVRNGAGSEAVHAAAVAIDRENWAWGAELQQARATMAPVRETRPARAAFVVGVSTLLGSAVPLVPFIVLPMAVAPFVALLCAIVVLFAAGVERARISGGVPLRAGIELVAIGVVSALAGYVIGQVLRAPAA